jgi:thiosulfate dehydrogenase [quinone] large subunit
MGNAGAARRGAATTVDVGPVFGLALAIMRIYFGLVFFTNGLAKFAPSIAHTPFGFLIDNPGAKGILTFYAHKNQVGLYRSLVDQFILPNWNFFGPAEGLVELIVGALLVLGMFTTLAALVGALLQLHLQFASLFSNQWLFEYSVEWIPLLVLAAVGAGRWYGLDGRRPHTARWLR